VTNEMYILMKKSFFILFITSLWTYSGVWAQTFSYSEKKTNMEEHVNFEGWPNCIRLSNGQVELIITTDIGPRIIRFGYINEQNMFHVSPADKGKTGGNDWHLYGGHRFWHAPEAAPRSYSPDNSPVKYEWDGKTLKLTQDIEPTTSMVKEMEISLSLGKNEVEVLHRIINHSCWSVELSPWAITACATGGRAIIPQEPYIAPADNLLPVRPIVLWSYTRMADPRYDWGDRFIQAKQNPSFVSETKIGLLNKQRWAAFYKNKTLFVKTFEYNPNVLYPDYGCNNEIYMNGDFLEVETLGPLVKVVPDGYVEHTEHWILAHTPNLSEDEEEMDRMLKPLLKSHLKEQ